MDVAVHVGRAAARGVERVPDPQRQPGPGARFVAGQEYRIACAGRAGRDVADRVLEPGDLVGGDRRVAHPAHQAHVVLTQPVAEGGLRGAHVDPLARQQVADPGRPGGAAVPQPVLPSPARRRRPSPRRSGRCTRPRSWTCPAWRGDHLGVGGLPGQFLEQPVGEARVPDPVGAQQRGQRRAALRQPARVLHGRGRGLHGGQVDPVLHDLQARADVAVDTRGEQGEQRLVVVQLRYLPEYHLVDIRGHRGGPAAHRRRDVGQYSPAPAGPSVSACGSRACGCCLPVAVPVRPRGSRICPSRVMMRAVESGTRSAGHARRNRAACGGGCPR